MNNTDLLEVTEPMQHLTPNRLELLIFHSFKLGQLDIPEQVDVQKFKNNHVKLPKLEMVYHLNKAVLLAVFAVNLL